MKTYLSIAVSIVASLGISTIAAARPGGGGAHFGGGHFGGAARYSADHRGGFWSGYWPFNEDWSYSGPVYSTPNDSDSDSTVTLVQKALARVNYYHGPIDGALDLITQDAIAKYDRNHHLPVTHAIDQSLLNALGVE
jgi:hypothetical protein